MTLEEGSYEKPIRRAAAPEPYPAKRAARGRWIRRLRPPVAPCDPWTPQAVFCETEPDPDDRRPRRTLTVLLTGRRCPWTCVMCDLWRRAAPGPIPPGAVPRQLAAALRTGAPNGLPAQALKLYNAGSFFDAAAVPPRDWPAVAAHAVGFERVIVESHPKLVDPGAARFLEALRAAARARGRPAPALEVALGLETAHPAVLEKLNKGATLEDFRRACAFLRGLGAEARAFVLLNPPFLPPEEHLPWAVRSAAFAFDCGAAVAAILPVRPGNGAIEALQERGLFHPAPIRLLEEALAACFRLGRGIVLADTWDLDRLECCRRCLPLRAENLERMNLSQTPSAPVVCPDCDPAGGQP
ncbi:MAG: radical SAM protein [Verrucomicrobia bacterium]|nr:radical SAM protein [Verrucomicrobiota bacterium]